MARFHIDRSPLGLGEAPKGLPSFPSEVRIPGVTPSGDIGVCWPLALGMCPRFKLGGTNQWRQSFGFWR